MYCTTCKRDVPTHPTIWHEGSCPTCHNQLLAPPTPYHHLKHGLNNGMLLEDALELALKKGIILPMTIMKKADLEVGKEYQYDFGDTFVKVLEIRDIPGDDDESCESVLVENRFAEQRWLRPSELSPKPERPKPAQEP